jgi:hypothetical protein
MIGTTLYAVGSDNCIYPVKVTNFEAKTKDVDAVYIEAIEEQDSDFYEIILNARNKKVYVSEFKTLERKHFFKTEAEAKAVLIAFYEEKEENLKSQLEIIKKTLNELKK